MDTSFEDDELSPFDRDERLTREERARALALADRLKRSNSQKIRLEIERFYEREAGMVFAVFHVFCGDTGHKARVPLGDRMPPKRELFAAWLRDVPKHIQRLIFTPFELEVAKAVIQ